MFDLGSDKYAYLQSPIHRWDARYKLVGLFALIFAFSLVRDLRLLPVLIVITALIFLASRLPADFVAARLKYPGVFLLAVAIVLPLFSGPTVLFQLGPVTIYEEGVLNLSIIVVRFVCILTLGIVLFATSPFLTNIKAMRALRLSPILADILMLTYRYLFEIGHELKTMETAMRLRHFSAARFSVRSVQTLAALSGTLLVRSYERSDQIYKAMILRGYGQGASGVAAHTQFSATRKDILLTALMLVLALSIVVAQVTIGRG